MNATHGAEVTSALVKEYHETRRVEMIIELVQLKNLNPVGVI